MICTCVKVEPCEHQGADWYVADKCPSIAWNLCDYQSEGFYLWGDWRWSEHSFTGGKVRGRYPRCCARSLFEDCMTLERWNEQQAWQSFFAAS